MKRTPLKRTSSLGRGGLQRSRKPINRYGRIAKERADRKAQWEADHPPLENKRGKKYYICHICAYFGEPEYVQVVLYERYVLEHIIPKGRLTLTESQEDENLGPSHVMCNLVKGSNELWEMEKSPKSGLPNPYPTWAQYAEYLLWSTKT